MIELLNIDCMEYMATLPDKAFELAIVDPPYKLGMNGGKSIGLRKCWPVSYGKEKHLKKDWDNQIPPPEYFIELQRISKNFIIWGGNYFSQYFKRIEHLISWDKQCEGTDFSHFEIAFTSFSAANRKITIPIQAESQRRIHPTQKPVALYQWLLKNYAKQGDKILDTHLGSGSSAIAADIMGFDFVGIEIDKDYFEAALGRFNRHKQQQVLCFN